MSDISFGTWLRHKRKALDLTRQVLARQAACAVITIEKIEIGERRPSNQVASALAAALHISPDEHAAFIAFARGQTASFAADVASLAPHNLPKHLPLLIGRDDDVAAVLARLRRPAQRFLTLVGPGGVGKTALAMQVAQRCSQGALGALCNDGVVFVDLSAVREADQVAGGIAQQLAALDQGSRSGASFASLADRLAERAMLLVLDNVEQVIDAVSHIAQLAGACPSLRILATSRVGLKAHGAPGAHDLPIEPLAQADAAALFVARPDRRPDVCTRARGYLGYRRAVSQARRFAVGD